MVRTDETDVVTGALLPLGGGDGGRIERRFTATTLHVASMTVRTARLTIRAADRLHSVIGIH